MKSKKEILEYLQDLKQTQKETDEGQAIEIGFEIQALEWVLEI